jgi:large subunit ribosomal protein L4
MATATLEENQTAVTVDRHNAAGTVIDKVELDATIFGVTPNVPLMHQVVTAQLAARRSGTHSTKTRSEVAGGGAKPYRQKGTGRARQGTIRAPQFAGGGVAFGPKPRSYAQRTPRKMVRLALHSALSDRVAEGRFRLIDEWAFEVPKTKDAVKALKALGLEGAILVVLGPGDATAERSFDNLPNVDLVEAGQLTAYEVLANEWVIFTSATVPGGFSVVPGSADAASAAAEDAAAADAASTAGAASAAAAASDGETSADAEDSADGEVTTAADAVAADTAAAASDGETSADAEDSADGEVTGAAAGDSSDAAEASQAHTVSAEAVAPGPAAAADVATEAEVSPPESTTSDDATDADEADQADETDDEEEEGA